MRKYLNLILLIGILTVMGISCQKGVNVEVNKDAHGIDAVKEWYYGVFKNSPEWASYNSALNKKKLPDWKHGIYLKFGDKEIVEFPLVKEKSTFLLVGKANLPENEKRQIVNSAISRVIFIKGKSGNIAVREMQYIPDMDYLTKHNFDISRNVIGKMDKDFSGAIVSKKWNGKEVARSVLKNGKIVSRLKPRNLQDKNTSQRTASCPAGYIEVTEYARDCESHLYGDGMFTYECGEWYPTGNGWCLPPEDIGDDPECEDPGSVECFCQLIGGCDEGGGDTNECSQQSVDEAVGSLTTTELGTKDEIETISETQTEITRRYKWSFAQINSGLGFGITFHSAEIGVQNIESGNWRFTSFTHEGTSQTGGAIFWDATVNSLTPTASITNINTGPPVNSIISIGGIQLQWGLKISYTCGVFLGSSYPTGTSNNSWYTHEH